MLTNQPGSNSWPITGATFILVYKKQERPEIAQEVLKFFDWAYHHGGDMASKLDYVPMPRITSYNVCYTKLLRLVVEDRAGAGR